MAASLVRAVHVDGVQVPAGTEETPELRARISNPRAWSGPSELDGSEQPAEGEVGELAVTVLHGEELAALVEASVDAAFAKYFATTELTESVEEPDADGELAGAGDAPVEPPRGGKGSGEEAWRAYAGQLGIDVTAANDRDGIIALVDQHKAVSP